MIKVVTFSGYDTAGPHIFPIDADVDSSLSHIKTARALPQEIERYIRNAKPVRGKTQLLIDALGAGEWWGSNSNADYFPEEALSHRGADYGYETFMHYAYPFRHHCNKDPGRAYGDKVTLSAYDPHMHRVLLIVSVHDEKCRDLLAGIENGEYPDVSMGCKVPFDLCSACHNRARNRSEYCTHLRYQPNRILQDGRRVYAINTRPKFFDISFVTIGAEKASHVLKKVAMTVPEGYGRLSATAGEEIYPKLAAAEKAALQKKRAEIEKEVPSRPPASVEAITAEDKAKLRQFSADCGRVKELERPLPTQLLNTLAQHPLKNVVATLAAMGIDLKPQEFQRVVLVKQGAGRLADALDANRVVFDEGRPGSKVPRWATSFQGVVPEDVSEKLAIALRPYVAERSCFPEVLRNRLKSMDKLADFPGYDRDNQWYPMTDEQKRLSSGTYGSMPASLALAAGFLVFKEAFPDLIAKTKATKTLARNPWLLPILLAAGVGATVGMQAGSEPMPLGLDGTGHGLDPSKRQQYHQAKTAAVRPLAHLGLIPLTYIYSGKQRQRWQRGEDIGALNRFIAKNPGVASMIGFSLAPYGARGASRLLKGASEDFSIVQSVQRIAQRVG